MGRIKRKRLQSSQRHGWVVGVCSVLLLMTAGQASAQSIASAEVTATHCFFGEALQELDRAPPREQASSEGQWLRARLLVQLERGREAVAILSNKALATTPAQEGDRLLLLGLAQGAAKDLPGAEATLRLALQAGSDRDLVEGAMATLRLRAGKMVEAEKMLRAVLRRTPTLTGALYNLAVVRSKAGDVAEAAALIRMGWELGHHDPFELERDPDLANLRSTKGLIDDLLRPRSPHCDTW